MTALSGVGPAVALKLAERVVDLEIDLKTKPFAQKGFAEIVDLGLRKRTRFAAKH